MINSFISIDFETANPQRVSACSLGFVKVLDGVVVDERSFFIKPVGEYSRFNISVHGIRPEQTESSPTFDQIFPLLKKDFETLPVLCYSPFDHSVFNALRDYYHLHLDGEVVFIDVYNIANQVLSGLPNYKLPTVACHLQLPYLDHHEAKNDALQCARIFQKLTQCELCGDIPDLSGDGNPEDKFVRFVKIAMADGLIDLEEAYQLQCFLDVMTSKGTIYRCLADMTKEVLADGVVTARESKLLMAMLEYAISEFDKADGFVSSAAVRVHRPAVATQANRKPNVDLPDSYEPVLKDIPTKYCERWEYVKTHPFETLASANVVITEEGVRISREDAEAIVPRLGGVLKSAVSRLTDFCVVLGMPTECCKTGKAEAAREQQVKGSPIRIINEDEFIALVEASLKETAQQ